MGFPSIFLYLHYSPFWMKQVRTALELVQGKTPCEIKCLCPKESTAFMKHKLLPGAKTIFLDLQQSLTQDLSSWAWSGCPISLGVRPGKWPLLRLGTLPGRGAWTRWCPAPCWCARSAASTPSEPWELPWRDGHRAGTGSARVTASHRHSWPWPQRWPSDKPSTSSQRQIW